MKTEMDNYFSTFNLIEQNIEKIKNAEKVISLLPLDEESDIDARNKINDDLAFINEMIRANREEIKLLKDKLSKSSYKFAELERTVVRLTKVLEEETLKVSALQAQLAQKDSMISTLNVNIDALSGNIESLESEKEKHITTIKDQDETIHTAWYVFGTRKELREQNIITSDGWFRPTRILESDFNKTYFVRIDARKTKAIPLYASRAKILSSHPRSAYTLEKENDTFTLLILDTKEFWSVSKYLVIEVD
ncbi:MAG: hypothetical protein Q7J05_07170 [Paludibacter sp.]|nr:hypothetical protein [Paludibacter sp.]